MAGIASAAGAGGLPTWMSYKRQLQLLPSFSTASTSFSHYRIPRPAGADPTATDGLICWGSVGNLPNPEPLPTVDFNVKYPDEFWDEKSRESQDVRIQNPDDPSQYIIDRRLKRVTFDKTSSASTSGPNTSAEVPAGISNYSNTDSFTSADSSQTKKTKVRVHYTEGHGANETPL